MGETESEKKEKAPLVANNVPTVAVTGTPPGNNTILADNGDIPMEADEEEMNKDVREDLF